MANDLVPAEPEPLDQILEEPFPLAEEAVRRFLQSGSLAQVGREMHIPVQDLYRAAKSAWWIQEVALRKRMEQAVQDAQISKVLDKSVSKLLELLERGEEFVDRNGQIVKKELSGVALARIIDVLFDKRQVLRGQPTGDDQTSKKLSELAHKLEQFGRAAQAKPIIDAEDATIKPASPGDSSASYPSSTPPKDGVVG